MQSLARAALTGICITVMVLSAWVFLREYRVVLLLGGTTNDQIAALAAADPAATAPMSARTARDLLRTCARLATSAPRLKAEPEMRQRVAARCGAIAKNLLVTAPSNARARAAAVLMAPALTAADLRSAQRAAPHEPWPLTTRLAAVEAAGPHLPEGVATTARADFSHALLSSWGRRELALLYVRAEWARPLLREAARPLGTAERKDFLDRIAAVVRAAGVGG